MLGEMGGVVSPRARLVDEQIVLEYDRGGSVMVMYFGSFGRVLVTKFLCC